MNALVYVAIDQGIYKGKMKVALNERWKKLHGFSFSINIANFEAFLLVFKLTKNPLFLMSAVCSRWIVDIKKPTVASFLVIIYSFFHHKIGKKKYQVSPKTVRGHNSSFKKFLQSIVNTLYQAQC